MARASPAFGSAARVRRSAAARAGRAADARKQALPGGTEELVLLGAEVIEEHRPHAGEMRGAGGGELAPAGRRQRRERAAGVARARLAGDEALALEAVDEAGQAAAAQDHGRGEVRHPHTLALRV